MVPAPYGRGTLAPGIRGKECGDIPRTTIADSCEHSSTVMLRTRRYFGVSGHQRFTVPGTPNKAIAKKIKKERE